MQINMNKKLFKLVWEMTEVIEDILSQVRSTLFKLMSTTSGYLYFETVSSRSSTIDRHPLVCNLTRILIVHPACKCVARIFFLFCLHLSHVQDIFTWRGCSPLYIKSREDSLGTLTPVLYLETVKFISDGKESDID